jgi:hypothetical protein
MSNIGESCRSVCGSLGDMFSCMRLITNYDQKTPFFEAIDVNDFRQFANIDCSTGESTDFYSDLSDPSFVVSSSTCRGYKNLTLIDCDAVGGNDVQRLCKCVDKGGISSHIYRLLSPLRNK